MSYFSFMAQGRKKVDWVYGFEIDYDVIERIDKERTLFSAYSGDSGYSSDEDCYSDPTERVTDYLRSEYDCIAPMTAWDPDSPKKERAYVLVVHAHSTPEYYNDRVKVMKRIARLKLEVMPEVKAKAKWYFSCNAGMYKGNIDWSNRPRPFFGRLKSRSQKSL